MACASQALISANACKFSSPTRLVNKHQNVMKKQQSFNRALADDSDCNVEECAPDKEVGKVSLEWLAGEKTKVVGTFPPRKKGWTGYVEKDTAGQTNIYSVEPAVYVAESALSSGTSGSSADGAENNVAIAAGIALIAIAAASSILLQVGKNSPQMQTSIYTGPSLSYYISKFKPPEVIPTSTEQIPSSTEPESSKPEVSQIQAESGDQTGPSPVTVSSVS